MIPFALNQMVAPQFPVRDFIDLAADVGCIGVELRNDLKSKGVSNFEFLDGESPRDIGDYACDRNIKILGLSEIYGFNIWTESIHDEIKHLIECACQCGAESISLIPDNSGAIDDAHTRRALLQEALEKIKPLLEYANITALIEPLGFSTATLQLKSEAMDIINAIQGAPSFKLVHDSFHHFLARESALFPDHTGVVHISSILETTLAPSEMTDLHRILVESGDRLGTTAQIKALIADGYKGAFSFEPFSPLIHQDQQIQQSLVVSMEYIRSQF